VQVSIDDGTNWITVATYTTVQWFSREVLDISDQVANSTFKVRFYYEATGEAYQWAVDEVQVWGTDGDIDFEAPSVSISSPPPSIFEGNDLDLTVNASDNVELDEVVLVYAKYNNGIVSEETEIVLTEGENEGEYPASIPNSYFSAVDTLVYYAKATDAVGFIGYNPSTAPTDRYSTIVLPEEFALHTHLLDNFTWYDTTGSTPIDIDVDSYYYCSDDISFESLGLDNFTWYGEEITHLYCGIKGWVVLSTSHDPSITANASNFTILPSTTENYNVIEIASRLSFNVASFKYKVEGNRLILTYTDSNSSDDFAVCAQLVLDTEYDDAYLCYDTFVWGAWTNVYIGFQHEASGSGENLVAGGGYDFPANEQTYSISLEPGYASGTVTNTVTSAPVENAEISLLRGEDVLISTLTNSTGNYSFNLPTMTGLTINASCGGYNDATVADVEVPIENTNTYDISLQFAGTIDTYTGTVISADTENLPIEDARVTISAISFTALTDEDGVFVFNDIPVGVHELEVSFDNFDGTYHQNQVFVNISVNEENTTGQFPILEILPPRNVTALPSELCVTLSWDEPLNHAEEATLLSYIDVRESLLKDYMSYNAQTSAQKNSIRVIRSEIARLKALLSAPKTNAIGLDELDDFGDFSGYRFKLDDNILENGVGTDETSHTLFLGDNYVDHTFAVAADYGYGDEFLVFSDAVTASGEGALEVDTTYAFNWIELRPSEGGNGIPLNIDVEDDFHVSQAISMDGMSINHYGITYDTFYIGTSGLITYDQIATIEDPSYTTEIPTEETPNTFVAPLWAYYSDGYSDENSDVWYIVDTANRRIVVQWSLPLYPGTVYQNIHNFQLIIYPDEDKYVFQYLSATYDWLWYSSFYRMSIVGVENEDGTEGYGVQKTLVDNCAIMVRFLQDTDVGLVTATVMIDNPQSDDLPCEGAQVRVDGTLLPNAVSNEDGIITFPTAEGTDHTFQFIKDGLWPSQILTGNVVIGETTDLGQVLLKTADFTYSPSSLDLEYIVGESDEVSGTITLSSSGSGDLVYLACIMDVNMETVPPWISVAPSSDTLGTGESQEIVFTVDIEDENLPTSETYVVGCVINVIEDDTTSIPIHYDYSNRASELSIFPDMYKLYPGRPNPFNPQTTISFDIVSTQHVSLSVFNMLGQKVASLVNTEIAAGRHSVTFDGINHASGLYLIRIDAGDFHDVQKVVLMK